MSGTLDEKLRAAAHAGFDGVEIFEPDFLASPRSPEDIRGIAADLGLSLDLYQPFRDFEGVSPELHRANLRRAAAKFDLMTRFGIDTLLLCSNVATAKSGDDQLAASQLRDLGDLAAAHGVRVAYEALAWGRFVDGYEHAARLVRLADHDAIGICLDSFHILSKGHDPEAIETIPGDKVFFVQMADAPQLSLDVLSWSRHYRVFPGEGAFDLGRFLGHLLRTGYDGPISLEVFNDTFRQSDPEETAIDAMRSLVLLQEQGRDWLDRHGGLGSAGGALAARERLDLDVAPAAAPPVDFNYVEVRSDDLDALRTALAQLGFADRGVHRSKPVELWTQGAARLVLGPTGGVGSAPAVAGLGFGVVDQDAAAARALAFRAAPVAREQAVGEERLVGFRAPDGSEAFFGDAGDGEPHWIGEFGTAGAADGQVDEDAAGTGILRVDHVNLAQPWQHFDAAVLFYSTVVGLAATPSTEVAAPIGLVRSQVLRTADGGVRVALNLAPSGDTGGAILPQHLAFATDDALGVARAARARGLAPLPIPANYYDDLDARYELDPGLLASLRELNVLYDRDAAGEFLHFYTGAIGSVFFEVVERRGGYEGYGAGNAPVRLAAQYERRRAGSAADAAVVAGPR
nr:sugar phosphate isomerase/epimerase and 4-hydroxyphenylpyruvate domain-containing protein [Agromyces seonyuensis]